MAQISSSTASTAHGHGHGHGFAHGHGLAGQTSAGSTRSSTGRIVQPSPPPGPPPQWLEESSAASDVDADVDADPDSGMARSLRQSTQGGVPGRSAGPSHSRMAPHQRSPRPSAAWAAPPDAAGTPLGGVRGEATGVSRPSEAQTLSSASQDGVGRPQLVHETATDSAGAPAAPVAPVAAGQDANPSEPRRAPSAAAPSAAAPAPATVMGLLLKADKLGRKWKRRPAVLVGSALYYFQTAAQRDSAVADGALEAYKPGVPVRGAVVDACSALPVSADALPMPEARHFTVAAANRRVYFAAVSAEELRAWVTALCSVTGQSPRDVLPLES
ncbi:hypothetical protein FNF29_05923 [Cafeteria roenbergensis]|uniref:PH domain-containing protein n=1 Tax=Cafeteria roenbergensis TaxID=33653 RepID=A0A5A8CA63_CAFRO|nr:hypothetical protein FNF29_05923 [Cafeteria roenbergensis]|eukprot:KAA0149537.1 hypothetical protein FNF29_05923 [Cafeteria roenbergensis]